MKPTVRIGDSKQIGEIAHYVNVVRGQMNPGKTATKDYVLGDFREKVTVTPKNW